MILDSIQQRDTLLSILHAAPISGNYQQVSDTVRVLDGLKASILNAEIRVEAKVTLPPQEEPQEA